MNVRARLLSMRAEIDALLAALPDDGRAATATPMATRRFMKIAEFGKLHGFCARTIREYCDLGMPHQGEGKSRRILVAEAEAWLAAGGPRAARLATRGHAA
jgi:hypothetical protein